MYKLMIGFCLLVMGISGCSDQGVSISQTFDIDRVNRGQNLKVISLTSDEYSFDLKQHDVSRGLHDLVNSGLYDIVSIETFYSGTFLTAAQVTYNDGVAGEGNKIKLALLLSSSGSLDDKQKKIRPQLDEILNDPDHEIIQSSPVYSDGYLVAAEIYYKDR